MFDRSINEKDLLNFPSNSVYDDLVTPSGYFAINKTAVGVANQSSSVIPASELVNSTIFTLATDLALSVAPISDKCALNDAETNSTAASAASSTITSHRACFGAGCYW